VLPVVLGSGLPDPKRRFAGDLTQPTHAWSIRLRTAEACARTIQNGTSFMVSKNVSIIESMSISSGWYVPIRICSRTTPASASQLPMWAAAS
jgi:hypothetical protein